MRKLNKKVEGGVASTRPTWTARRGGSSPLSGTSLHYLLLSPGQVPASRISGPHLPPPSTSRQRFTFTGWRRGLELRHRSPPAQAEKSVSNHGAVTDLAFWYFSFA